MKLVCMGIRKEGVGKVEVDGVSGGMEGVNLGERRR